VRQHELTRRILQLRGVPTLRTLAPSELLQLASSMRLRTFHRGDVILSENEPPRAFFLVTEGTVTMRRHGNRIGTVRAPGAVGFMSFIARNAGSTAAVAESYVEALEVAAESMDEVFDDHFSVLLSTLRLVSERLMQEMRDQPPPPYSPPEMAFDHLVGDGELGIVERIFLLRRMRAFREANVNSLATVARKMTELRVPAGETLWRPGDRADFSLFVVKGMLRLTWRDDHEPQRVGPGYALGGAEALSGLPRWNELVSEEPVVALRASRENMIDLFEDDRELAVSFLSMLGTMLVTRWDERAEAGLISVGTDAPTGPPPGVVASPPVGPPSRPGPPPPGT